MVEPLQGNTKSEYIVPGAHDEEGDAGKTEFAQPEKKNGSINSLNDLQLPSGEHMEMTEPGFFFLKVMA